MGGFVSFGWRLFLGFTAGLLIFIDLWVCVFRFEGKSFWVLAPDFDFGELLCWIDLVI